MAVYFQGVEMADDWPEEIHKAQSNPTYTIDGQQFPRIRYGDEPSDPRHLADRNCHDCGVVRGQFHVPSCDWERCPACKGQVLICGCVDE